jgi:hypothetical protein
MGHKITALIGSRRALSRLIEQFGPPATTELIEGLVIMPLGNLRLDLLKEAPAPIHDGFAYLSSEVEAGIVAGVGTEPALYIETEYFGGTGAQGAALFADGKLMWRRTISTEDTGTIVAKTPISQGLAALGVRSAGGQDEFDTVGLSRFRSLEELGLFEWEDED